MFLIESLCNILYLEIIARIADFGISVNAETLSNFYPKKPTKSDNTINYSPPEVLFSKDLPYYLNKPTSYDMWSLGVVVLEMIFGTSNIFITSDKDKITAAIETMHTDYQNLQHIFN